MFVFESYSERYVGELEKLRILGQKKRVTPVNFRTTKKRG